MTAGSHFRACLSIASAPRSWPVGRVSTFIADHEEGPTARRLRPQPRVGKRAEGDRIQHSGRRRGGVLGSPRRARRADRYLGPASLVAVAEVTRNARPSHDLVIVVKAEASAVHSAKVMKTPPMSRSPYQSRSKAPRLNSLSVHVAVMPASDVSEAILAKMRVPIVGSNQSASVARGASNVVVGRSCKRSNQLLPLCSITNSLEVGVVLSEQGISTRQVLRVRHLLMVSAYCRRSPSSFMRSWPGQAARVDREPDATWTTAPRCRSSVKSGHR